jgi:LPXTG-motif cell wall-anchored protein
MPTTLANTGGTFDVAPLVIGLGMVAAGAFALRRRNN